MAGPPYGILENGQEKEKRSENACRDGCSLIPELCERRKFFPPSTWSGNEEWRMCSVVSNPGFLFPIWLAALEKNSLEGFCMCTITYAVVPYKCTEHCNIMGEALLQKC